jgi:hypothetical protein
MEKGFNSIMKVYVLVLLAMCLLAVPSCKKSSQESPSSPQKNDTATTTSEKTDASKQPVVDANAPRLVPLDIKLPRPMFVGTPQNIQGVTNLEKPLGRDRPPFYAPAGTKNAALGKPAASTDDLPIIGEIEMVTDGDKEATDGSYVELAPFLQNVTIDLGAEYEIYAILFWHYHKQARVYFDVVVQVADDPDFITDVRTLFNNDHDNSSGLGIGSDMHYVETAEGKLIDAKGVRARYVRLYSNGSSSNELNHYIEVEVFGKPAI